MKVGVFLPEIGPESGGAFTFVETIVAGLVGISGNDEITVFHYGSAANAAAKLGSKIRFQSLGALGLSRRIKRAWYLAMGARCQQFEFQVLRKLRLSFGYPVASSLDRATRRAEIDFLICPTPAYETVECPYAITVWDLEHRAQPYFPEVSARGEWHGREDYFAGALRRASYVITGTEVGKREITGAYGIHPDRVRILPHPTPSFALEQAGKTPLPAKLGLKSPYVFYPAQFWAHKNHVGLVEAIALLKSKGLEVHGAFVGADKCNQAHVREVARAAGVQDRVHFLGFVSREELVALYQNALALVYPSLCGPENLPPLEAMALECPVIAADIPGSREQLGDSAILVNGLDAAAIAEKIAVLNDENALRVDLVKKGKSRANRYRHQEFVRDLGSILAEFRLIRRLW